jgi:hypothetical protein
MALKTKPAKGTIQKQSFDIMAYQKSKGLTRTSKPKELSWVPLSEPFQEALGIPGIPRGYTSLARGYSNTGKSTSIYETIIGCNRIGDLPIIFDTEGNFNWEHAKTVGVEFEEIIDENGNKDYVGDFMYISNRKLLDMYQNWDYDEAKEKSKPTRNEPVIEDIARFIDECLDDQEAGNLPRNLCFLWDSIGSIDCFRCVKSKSKNNMWNAGALETSFKSILNFRISDSQRSDSEYTNTFFAVQKIWFDNMNTVIKHKGGEAFFYGSRLIIHFGGILTHGTAKLNAEITDKGVKMNYQYGIEAKVKCEKNQVNGIEQMGKLASTSHGYWNPEKLSDYKTKHKDFILSKLNADFGDINLTKEENDSIGAEDLA